MKISVINFTIAAAGTNMKQINTVKKIPTNMPATKFIIFLIISLTFMNLFSHTFINLIYYLHFSLWNFFLLTISTNNVIIKLAANIINTPPIK